MLINFTVTNYLSFKDKTQFTMVASEEISEFDERLTKVKSPKFGLLPVSAIYGSNAAGKSNFVSALSFVRDFVSVGTQKKETRIEVSPFLLNKKHKNMFTNFEIDFLVDNKIYQYSFSANATAIDTERLIATDGSGDKLQFERVGNKYKFSGVFDTLEKNDMNLYIYASKLTRKNQLYLTNLALQNADILKNIYDWFDKLVLIGPSSTFNSVPYFKKQHPLTQVLNEVVQKLDFGISAVTAEKIEFNGEVPDELKKDVLSELSNGSIIMLRNPAGDQLKLSIKGGEIVAEKLMASHVDNNGNDIKFSFKMESDGTKRIMDLVPALYSLANLDRVVIIDEIERSLHPILIRRLFESYFESIKAKKLKSQLIFTTHSVDLMNESLLRPDELWIIDKGIDGVSKLSSLSQFEQTQSELDFQRSFLEGRFGGVPHIQFGGIFDKPLDLG